MRPTSSEWDHGPPMHARVRRFADFEVSWAGQCDLNGGFCFGSEDGRILLMNEDGGNIQGLKESPVSSREAINGLAFPQRLIALSTRAEVVFVSQRPTRGKGYKSVFSAGAHSILATPSGRCVAPLGRSGLMSVTPVEGEHQPVTVSTAQGRDLYFYRTAYVPGSGSEVIACAARHGGVVGLNLAEGRKDRSISTLEHPELDIVDVCALGDTEVWSPAVAAVSRDCTILLSRNVLSDKRPFRLTFSQVDGAAYRLLCARGHLVLLTSNAIYLFIGLAQRFLAGEDVRFQRTSVRTIPVEAVDANIGGDHWILVVVPQGVMMIDLDRLAGDHAKTEQGDPGIEDVANVPGSVELEGQFQEVHTEEREEMLVGAGTGATG